MFVLSLFYHCFITILSLFYPKTNKDRIVLRIRESAENEQKKRQEYRIGELDSQTDKISVMKTVALSVFPDKQNRAARTSCCIILRSIEDGMDRGWINLNGAILQGVQKKIVAGQE